MRVFFIFLAMHTLGSNFSRADNSQSTLVDTRHMMLEVLNDQSSRPRGKCYASLNSDAGCWNKEVLSECGTIDPGYCMPKGKADMFGNYFCKCRSDL